MLLATRFGFPISATRVLLGGLVVAGLMASSTGLKHALLVNGFLLPLLLSPFLAVATSGAIYPALRLGRRLLGISQETCMCVGDGIVGVVPGAPGREQAQKAVTLPTLAVDVVPGARSDIEVVIGVSGRPAGRGPLSQCRRGQLRSGLNDTPKIAALLLVGQSMSPTAAIVAVSVAMAVGGLIHARRVAEMMAHRMTDMNPGQGFTVNAITALLVMERLPPTLGTDPASARILRGYRNPDGIAE